MPIPTLTDLLAAVRAVSDDVVAELHRALNGPPARALRPAAIHYSHAGGDAGGRERAAAG